MAYTQDQINAAYAAERANGASDADLQAIGASKYGVTGEQFNLASAAYAPAPSAAPAAAPAAAPTFGRFSEDQYAAARNWADGRSGKDILGKANELKLTNDELGYLFKEHGGSGQQVEDITGYASRNGHAWSTDKERSLDGWVYNKEKGWSKPARSSGGAPKTGINLSDLQESTSWDVQPNETVRSQLQQIIADDSPLMQQARARALQSANSRGLLNSSMAMTAADSAMYDAAMPIATQDASTYARAGEFNANTKNTFSRDNNQFVRDAYMADFNVQANDWAAEQQFDREYQMLDRQQQLTLDRDAIQNGYTSARDAALNGYQVGRDTTQNNFNANESAADRALRLQLAQMDSAARASSVQPDTSLERLRMQIDANKQADSVKLLNDLRSDFAAKTFKVNAEDVSPEKAKKSVEDLAATYNKMIETTAIGLGYKPTDWMIKIETPVKKAQAQLPADAGKSGFA